MIEERRQRLALNDLNASFADYQFGGTDKVSEHQRLNREHGRDLENEHCTDGEKRTPAPLLS